jgi:hypothetical protein
MKYKLINKTKIPREDLELLIEFCAPKGIKNFNVVVSYDKKFEWHAFAYPFKKKNAVHIYIQKKPIHFPRLSNCRAAEKAGYSPTCRIQNKYELLVYLFSHELRHIWQGTVSNQNFFRTTIRNYTNSDGSQESSVYKMERDACKYAKKIIEKYRKL